MLNAVGAVAGRARLMRTADGWPAVLGLAAMSGDVDFSSSRLLSRTLYDFLASELLAAATEETQAGLMLLAVASVTDVEVARGILGSDADRVMDDAVARGLVAITDRKSLSLHPLLRELLTRRFEDADDETREALALAEPGSCSSCAAGTRRSALPRWRRMRPSPPRQSEPRWTTS